MAGNRFIIVGENIHCTRIYKVGGKHVHEDGGGHYIGYRHGTAEQRLPVPEAFISSDDWANGKVKHCAVAMWQARHGDTGARACGEDYIRAMAKRQEQAGATYLDINVDEYSTDLGERIELMKWSVDIVQNAVSVPVSVDSSNIDILRAGLGACDPERGKPMVNSVSLEREDAIALAAELGAVVIASAAGRSDLPSTADERLANLAVLVPKLREAGFSAPDMHIDPLVFPISTDTSSGRSFLDAVAALRREYGADVHIVAGLSNVSFGMPKRSLINRVFAYLSRETGADGGIVDPDQINTAILDALDTSDDAFQLARTLLLGEDDFGMEYIAACRGGRI